MAVSKSEVDPLRVDIVRALSKHRGKVAVNALKKLLPDNASNTSIANALASAERDEIVEIDSDTKTVSLRDLGWRISKMY